eukprot:6825155-Lingulodinium_polyedra.AAC.1
MATTSSSPPPAFPQALTRPPPWPPPHQSLPSPSLHHPLTRPSPPCHQPFTITLILAGQPHPPVSTIVITTAILVIVPSP